MALKRSLYWLCGARSNILPVHVGGVCVFVSFYHLTLLMLRLYGTTEPRNVYRFEWREPKTLFFLYKVRIVALKQN